MSLIAPGHGVNDSLTGADDVLTSLPFRDNLRFVVIHGMRKRAS